MKKIIFGLLFAVFAVFALSSCEKVATDDSNFDVSFNVNKPTLEQSYSKKGGGDELMPNCVDKEASYVKLWINGVEYTLDLVNIGDGTQTQVIQLPGGTYVVEDFVVFAADGTPLYASPHEGTYYDNLFNFVNNVKVKFKLKDWHKNKINIDVLCVDEATYENFGFVWFDYHAYIVHTTCFYGDVCTKFWEEWGAYGNADVNPYWGWTGGYDTYAVYEVQVTGPDGTITIGTNYPFNPKKPKPVCVEWLDDTEINGEVYEYAIYIYTPEGNKVLVYEGSFTDQEPLGSNELGDIFNFVVGGSDCNYEGNHVDLNVILPWIPLPETVDFHLFNNGNASYFGIKILDAQPSVNSEFATGNIFNAWCGKKTLTITYGHDYRANVYAWYDLIGNPLFNYTQAQVDVLTYIANNLNQLLADYGKNEVQKLIWDTIGDTSGTTSIVLPNTSGYIPPVGGYAVVILDPVKDLTLSTNCTEKHYQLVIVRVDP